MPDFRRYRVPGGCYFFTANLLERRGNTLLTDRLDLLRESVRRVRAAVPSLSMPGRPSGSYARRLDIAARRRRLLDPLASDQDLLRACPARTEWRSCVRRADGERGIWQRRFWEHAIGDDGDYATHMDYVHFNPVKHGLVASPAAWPYSTFKSCARRGLYPLDWIGSGIQDVPAGEPGE